MATTLKEPTREHLRNALQLLDLGDIAGARRRITAAMHSLQAYPHVGGCLGCAEVGVCNVCGQDIHRDAGRCTNGRCFECHVHVCTPGGGTSAGHGFGHIH